jgi:hypothetical protein
MIYVAAIAVCLATTPVAECQEPTAVSWMVAPEVQTSQGGCLRHGMMFAATSNMVTEGTYAKVFCSAGGQSAAWKTPSQAR